LVEEKKFSGISNMLITGPAYLQNVFLFTLTKSAELLFLFVQGNRPRFGHGGGGAFGAGASSME
jgi:hypothetical protein